LAGPYNRALLNGTRTFTRDFKTALGEKVGFELAAFFGRPSPQPKSRCNRNHGNSGGEGGILAIVIKCLSEFLSVDALPGSSVFSAFISSARESRSECGDGRGQNRGLFSRSGSKR
jgi:hypothetical protein